MDLFFPSRYSHDFRKDSPALLAYVWFLGLLTGLIVSVHAEKLFSSLMRQAFASPVSIVGLLCAVFLPLFLSAFSAYTRMRYFMLPIVYIKAFLYIFCSYGVFAVFGCASWLGRLLLIFSDTLMLPLYWLFWLRLYRGMQADLLWDLVWISSAALVIGSIDYRLISPLLAEISSF